VSHKRAKKIRKEMRLANIPIAAYLYQKNTKTGQILANQGRRVYRTLKTLPLKETLKILERKRIQNIKILKEGGDGL